MQSREWRAAEEHGIAAENQPHEVLEDRLFDRIAVELQRDAIEAVDVGQRRQDQS